MFSLPNTIDGVIEELKGIIRDSIGRRDRLGYFAALYCRVTEAVRGAIARNEFDDGARMEKLDVMFANRYLEAYRQYHAGELPSRSWLKAFEAASKVDHIVLQHLMIGMNAHINLDLGIAAARTAPGSEIAGLQDDFNRINTILATLTPVVEHEIDEESKEFAALTKLAPKLELKAAGFAMRGARDIAWDLALELAPLDPRAQLATMHRRDGDTVLFGDAILCDGLLVHIIRKRESADVARNIELLASGEFDHGIPHRSDSTAADAGTTRTR